MKEFLYGIGTAWIAAALLVSMLLAIESGHRFGRKTSERATDGYKSHVNAIAGALLGLLALVLGFTFSMALQRYDSRSDAVVQEANAIGTAHLRSQLLPASVRDDTRRLLTEYVDTRVRAGAVALIDTTERAALLAESVRLHASLWALAARAAEEAPNPVTSGLYVQALNDVIDRYGERTAALDRHVPEVVLLFLYFTFVMAGVIVGFASGVSGHRASVVTYILTGLIVVLVFVILDLDRPRRGLIQVSQKALVELRDDMHRGTRPVTAPASR